MAKSAQQNGGVQAKHKIAKSHTSDHAYPFWHSSERIFGRCEFRNRIGRFILAVKSKKMLLLKIVLPLQCIAVKKDYGSRNRKGTVKYFVTLLLLPYDL